MKKDYAVVVGSAAVSLFLLIVFGWLLAQESKLLQLPTQWLAVSLLPIIVALFIGGFITKFKGFGVELESTLKAPVTSLDLTASDAVKEIPGDDKQSLHYLQELQYEKKQAARRLSFRSGKVGYYTPRNVNEYIKELPNINGMRLVGGQSHAHPRG